MEKELIHDIIEWDILNWSKAISYWSKEVDLQSKKYLCLELGGRRGGLSLWLALNNNEVMCSDLNSPKEGATPLHKKYGMANKISYKAIDAINIPYQDHFDLVVFKSILGGISRNGQDKLKERTLNEIYKCLKPGGKLLFAENMESSVLHTFMRKNFIRWGSGWNYLNYRDINQIFGKFKNIKYETVGFFGAFGRTEKQRNILGKLDSFLAPLIPKSSRYIVMGVAEK